MAQFNDETKKEFGAYFSEGVHKVKITAVIGGTTEAGKEYFEFTLKGDGGEEGTARLWWTEKAMQRSFDTVKKIFVHNTPDDKKDAIRAEVDKCNDTDSLLKLAQALKGKEAWYQVERTETTYVAPSGEVKNSYNRNIYGWEPKPKQMTAAQLLGGTPVDTAPDDIPFN